MQNPRNLSRYKWRLYFHDFLSKLCKIIIFHYFYKLKWKCSTVLCIKVGENANAARMFSVSMDKLGERAAVSKIKI